MGSRNLAYHADFPAGAAVRIAPLEVLATFKRPDYRYHHPILEPQLAFAASEGKILRVGFYHGGDVLYELEGIPGIWHEKCLLPT